MVQFNIILCNIITFLQIERWCHASDG